MSRALASMGQKPANIGEMISACATNAVSRAILGRRVMSQIGYGDGDVKSGELKAMINEAMVLAGVFTIGDFIPPLEGLDLQGMVAKMKKLHVRFDAFLSSILEEHKMKGSDEPKGKMDLLSTLISLKDVDDVDGEGGRLTDTEIKALLLVCFSLPSLLIILVPFYLK